MRKGWLRSQEEARPTMKPEEGKAVAEHGISQRGHRGEERSASEPWGAPVFGRAVECPFSAPLFLPWGIMWLQVPSVYRVSQVSFSSPDLFLVKRIASVYL